MSEMENETIELNAIELVGASQVPSYGSIPVEDQDNVTESVSTISLPPATKDTRRNSTARRMSFQNVLDVDVDLINKSLNDVNPFHKRKGADKSNIRVLMLEISSDKESEYIQRTLRELLGHVNFEANELDDALNQIHSHFGETSVPFSVDAPMAGAGSPQNHHDGSHDAVFALRLRDLRRMDFQFNPVDEPTILVRRHAVLMSLDPIRAVVMANKLILIVPDGADSLLQILENFMIEWKQQKDDIHFEIPFEAHAYDALLTTVNALQEQDYDFVNKEVTDLLAYFKVGSLLSLSKQEKMRTLKNTVAAMITRIAGYKRVVMDLMEDDEAMALMNLSKLSHSPELYRAPLVQEIMTSHENIEGLLESYLMDYNSMEAKLNNLKTQMQSAEELVSLRLDTSRNELLVANTAFAVLACSIGFGAYITGVFGMNLDNTVTIQPVSGVFPIVFAGSFVFIVISFLFVVWYLTAAGILPRRTAEK